MTQQVTVAPPRRSAARCLDTALLLASELVANAVTAARAMSPAGPIVLAGLSRHRGCHDRDPHHRRQQRARL